MCRAGSLCIVLCLATLSFAQAQAGTAMSSTTPQQLVYVVDGSNLITYDINSQTLQATEAGTITLAQSVYPGLVTSPDGQFLYVTAYQNTNQQGERLYVYGTNSSGVPSSIPIQTLDVLAFSSPFVDPTGKFFYAVHRGTVGVNTTTYTIARYLINATTGRLSQPVTEAKYSLPTNALYCSLGIFGMNAAGTMMYDDISCGYPHGGAEVTYNERTVDPTTGALGPDQKIYYWNNASGGGEIVQFEKNLMFDFVIPDNYSQNANYVDVYPLQPNVSKPTIHCTESMDADCGSFVWGLVHPSAQYVFTVMPSSYVTNIDKVELSSKQIVATSSTIPYEVQQFSPDGKIAYAANDLSNGGLNIQIYGFNVTNAQVTAGGLINLPSGLDPWFAAERQ